MSKTREETRARQRAHHNPTERAYGLMCHKHFEQRGATWAEVDNCADCLAAEREEEERIQRNHTIDPRQPYGQHIQLTCKNHPMLRWHTKNIDYIGARTLFYTSKAPECDCSIRDLIVVNPEPTLMKPAQPDSVTHQVLAAIPRQTFVRRDAIDAARRRNCTVCVERLMLGRGLCPRCDPGGYRRS